MQVDVSSPASRGGSVPLDYLASPFSDSHQTHFSSGPSSPDRKISSLQASASAPSAASPASLSRRTLGPSDQDQAVAPQAPSEFHDLRELLISDDDPLSNPPVLDDPSGFLEEHLAKEDAAKKKTARIVSAPPERRRPQHVASTESRDTHKFKSLEQEQPKPQQPQSAPSVLGNRGPLAMNLASYLSKGSEASSKNKSGSVASRRGSSQLSSGRAISGAEKERLKREEEARLEAERLQLEEEERLRLEEEQRLQEEARREAELEREFEMRLNEIYNSPDTSPRESSLRAASHGESSTVDAADHIPVYLGEVKAAHSSQAEPSDSPSEAPGGAPVNMEKALRQAEHFWSSGETERALEALLGATAVAKVYGDRAAEGHALVRTALLHEQLGDHAQALECHHRRLEIAIEDENYKDQADAYNNISHNYLMQGQMANFRLMAEKARKARREARRGIERGSSAAVEKAEAYLLAGETKAKQREEEERIQKEQARESQEADVMDAEHESLMGLVEILKRRPEDRDDSDLNLLSSILDEIPYLHVRTTAVQRRELGKRAIYEKHQEAFPLYEVGDSANKAWIVLGCTPVLPDYSGSVDIMGVDAEGKEEIMFVIHNGELVGQDALDGAPLRLDSAIVSDDGQDDVITENHYLTILREDFEETIATFFHHSFQCFPYDESLKAQWADLGDAGARDICWHLINGRNETLTSLDLQYNNIGTDGAQWVADLLESNHTLRFLELSNNCIGDTGVKLICNSLLQNPTLQSLGLRANLLTEVSSWLLRDTVARNTSLTALDVKENDISFADLMPVYSSSSSHPKRTRDYRYPISLRPLAEIVPAPRKRLGDDAASWTGGPAVAQQKALVSDCIEDVLRRLMNSISASDKYAQAMYKWNLSEEPKVCPAVRKLLRSRVTLWRWQGMLPLKKAFAKADVERRLMLDRLRVMEVLKDFKIRIDRDMGDTLVQVYGLDPPKEKFADNTSKIPGPEIVYPFLIEVVEGNCQDEIADFFERKGGWDLQPNLLPTPRKGVGGAGLFPVS